MRPDPQARSARLLNRRSTLSLCAAAAAVLCLPACASEALVRTQPVQLSIIDRDSGQPLSTYRKDGRSFVAGQPASRYAIRLSNPTARRVLVVLSVDGINVISGETAAYGQTGYVLDPYRTHDITGWRKSDSAVAAFEFAALADSYAARTGRADHVGVIGAAVFFEKPAPVPVPAPLSPPPMAAAKAGAQTAAAAAPSEAMSDSAARSAAVQQERSERLGTSHGDREWSVSRRTQFDRLGSMPQQLIELSYDSRANLLAAGVIPAVPEHPQRPRPFPDEQARAYVPDPPR